MSGGVDSSIAAYLALKEFDDAIAATIRTGSFSCGGDEDSCAATRAVEDARAVAKALGIEHYTLDLSEPFKKHVIDYFINSYVTGQTPNPCIECNRYIKFGALLDFALGKGATKIVTGHYARVVNENGRYLVKRADDPAKDQSYVLWRLSQKQLSHINFPLAGIARGARACRLARACHGKKAGEPRHLLYSRHGLCRLHRKDRRLHIPPGDFVDTSGRVLGRHRGLIHYTTGQRKGLGLSLGEPMYVMSKDPEKNTVTLCREPELYTKRLVARSINLIAADSLPGPVRVGAKTRYSQKEVPATTHQTGSTSLGRIDTPVRAITHGSRCAVCAIPCWAGYYSSIVI